MPEHADPDFEARYGFCPVPCQECARLDEKELVTGVTGQEVLEQAWTMAMRALADQQREQP